MESIISRIIEIDKQAEQKLSEAKELQKQLALDAQAEADFLEQTLIEKADKAIANVEAVNKLEFENITYENQKKHSEIIKSLDDFYDREHEKIESLIFEQIVGEIS